MTRPPSDRYQKLGRAPVLTLAEVMTARRRSKTSALPRTATSTLTLACVRLQQIVFVLVVTLGLCVTVVTLHNYHAIEDPIKVIGLLDKLSLFLKVHEQSAVVIIDIGLYSSTVYCYTFHRHVSDGSFAIAKEEKKQILNGIFDRDANFQANEMRIDEVVKTAVSLIPKTVSDAGTQDTNLPILAKLSIQVLNQAGKTSENLSKGVELLSLRLRNESKFFFDEDASLGTLEQDEERVLQWFSINLLTHKLKHFQAHNSAVILDVGPNDLSVTLAVNSRQAMPEGNVTSFTHKLTAFGHLIRLVTLTFSDLGLYKARLNMLTNVSSHHEKEDPIQLRSACMNPITETHWQWNGLNYHVMGKEQSDFEVIKERNGPFAGKKINRPVANYDQCHHVANAHLNQHVGKAEATFLKNLLRNRQVFMEGLLLEKTMERGLTLPYKGGHVVMKHFIESLQHACKVPNTDQPFGCVDMMYLASLMDWMFGFKQSSVLYSSCDVGGMTGEWPLAAAFHIYENGL